jgi:hypothetical protein
VTGTLLTTVEVAERLGLSSAAVAQAVRTGALQPTARTNDDLLFTDRAVAAFAERRAAAASSPLTPRAPGTRVEWSGDLDRLNSWLKDLTAAMPFPVADPVSRSPSVLAPVVEAPALDFTPPPVAPSPSPTQGGSTAEGGEAAAPPPVILPEPVPQAAIAESVEPVPAPRAEPAVAEIEPERPAPTPVPARSLLERLEAAKPVVTAPAVAPTPPQPAPPAPEPKPVAEVPERVPPPSEPVATPGVELSRQALLVVQPIVRFRVLRDVAGRLAAIPGVGDARLERLENGVASYRVSFEGERPSGDAVGAALADLNLVVILVDSFL